MDTVNVGDILRENETGRIAVVVGVIYERQKKYLIEEHRSSYGIFKFQFVQDDVWYFYDRIVEYKVGN
jgi:hypothetical protein